MVSDIWAGRGLKRDKPKNKLLSDGKSKAPVLTQEFRQVRIYKSPEPDPDDLFDILERTTQARYEDQRIDPRSMRATKRCACDKQTWAHGRAVTTEALTQRTQPTHVVLLWLFCSTGNLMTAVEASLAAAPAAAAAAAAAAGSSAAPASTQTPSPGKAAPLTASSTATNSTSTSTSTSISTPTGPKPASPMSPPAPPAPALAVTEAAASASALLSPRRAIDSRQRLYFAQEFLRTEQTYVQQLDTIAKVRSVSRLPLAAPLRPLN